MLRERVARRLERRRARPPELARRLSIPEPAGRSRARLRRRVPRGARLRRSRRPDVAIGERIRVRLHEGELGAVVREGGRIPDAGPLFRPGRRSRDGACKEGPELRGGHGASRGDRGGARRGGPRPREAVRPLPGGHGARALLRRGSSREVEKSVEIVLKESAEEWKTAPFDPAGRTEEDERGLSADEGRRRLPRAAARGRRSRARAAAAGGRLRGPATCTAPSATRSSREASACARSCAWRRREVLGAPHRGRRSSRPAASR